MFLKQDETEVDKGILFQSWHLFCRCLSIHSTVRSSLGSGELRLGLNYRMLLHCLQTEYKAWKGNLSYVATLNI